MKAVVLREFGPPEVMRVEDVPNPAPGPGEVVIDVHAVSVNRTLDLVLRAGAYAGYTPSLPHVLGVDPAGIVVRVGDGVSAQLLGKHVAYGSWGRHTTPGAALKRLGVHVWGGYAEQVALPADALAVIPDNVDIQTGAVIARHAPVAFHQLEDKAQLQPGEWVLVMGAAGGLGSFAVQVAKLMGGKVIAAAGADARVQAAMALGADAGVNYRAQDLTEEVRRITEGRGVDVVLENIGDPELFPMAFAAIAPFGRLVTAGGHGGGQVSLDVNRLYLNKITVMGAPTPSEANYAAAMRAAGDGKLTAQIDRVLPLGEAVAAHRLVAERAALGKVLLDPTL